MKKIIWGICASMFCLTGFATTSFADDDQITCRVQVSFEDKVMEASDDGDTLKKARREAIEEACEDICQDEKACEKSCRHESMVNGIVCYDVTGKEIFSEGAAPARKHKNQSKLHKKGHKNMKRQGRHDRPFYER